MNREEIIAKVENITGIDVDEVTDICEDWIDWVQNDICRRYDFSFLIDYLYWRAAQATLRFDSHN